jgi:signal peptidase II
VIAGSSRFRWTWVVLGILLADQVSKWEVGRLIRPDAARVVVPGLLNLLHTTNPGVAFGLFADSHSPWLASILILFSAVVMSLLVWLLFAGCAGGRWGELGMALILGGAAGNVLDRILHRSVTDFLDFHLGDHHWPAFNLADSAIAVGAALVLVELFRDWRHPDVERI